MSSKIGFSEVTFINIEPRTIIEADNDEIKIEPFEIVDNGDYFDEKEVKREDSDNHSVFSNNDRLLSSDDDEPLSKHKEKKKEKRGRKRKKSDVEKRTKVDKKVESDLPVSLFNRDCVLNIFSYIEKGHSNKYHTQISYQFDWENNSTFQKTIAT